MAEKIENDFTPIVPDPQYILQVNALKKYFPITLSQPHDYRTSDRDIR